MIRLTYRNSNKLNHYLFKQRKANAHENPEKDLLILH